MIQLLILTGGLATRLKHLVKYKPKALIEINNKPFISYQLSLAKLKGIEEVVLCVGHLGEMIKDYVGNGSKWGLKVDYSFDGNKQLGTAGAIKKALKLLNTDFFILYGDSYLDVSYKKIEDFYFKSNSKALMTIIKNDNNWDKSNVILKNNKSLEYNKNLHKKNMNYIDYGISILNKNIFLNSSTKNFSDLSDIYHYLSNASQLMGYEVFNRFYEIGTTKGIKDTQKFLLMKGTK